MITSYQGFSERKDWMIERLLGMGTPTWINHIIIPVTTKKKIENQAKHMAQIETAVTLLREQETPFTWTRMTIDEKMCSQRMRVTYQRDTVYLHTVSDCLIERGELVQGEPMVGVVERQERRSAVDGEVSLAGSRECVCGARVGCVYEGSSSPDMKRNSFIIANLQNINIRTST